MSFEVSWGEKVKTSHPGLVGGGRPSIYPWDKLEEPAQDVEGTAVYSQFFVPGKTTKKFSSLAASAGKKLGVTFAVRAAQQNGVEGVLVQRVEYREPKVRTPEQIAAAKAAAAKRKAATAA